MQIKKKSIVEKKAHKFNIFPTTSHHNSRMPTSDNSYQHSAYRPAVALSPVITAVIKEGLEKKND